jgi:hypothetical protein
MAKHNYTIYLSYGFTVSSDEYLDIDKDFYTLRDLAISKLSNIGLDEIVQEADLGEIDYDGEED